MSLTKKTAIISVQDVPVTILSMDPKDYISLTDMAKARIGFAWAADAIKNWRRTHSALELLGASARRQMLETGKYFVTVPDLIRVFVLDQSMPQLNPVARIGEHAAVTPCPPPGVSDAAGPGGLRSPQLRPRCGLQTLLPIS